MIYHNDVSSYWHHSLRFRNNLWAMAIFYFDTAALKCQVLKIAHFKISNARGYR